jgi:nucleoside-diphosphate-sugar epimerase
MGREVCGRNSGIKDFELNVLVTGATGFLGRHIVNELLTNGHQVIGISRNLVSAEKLWWFKKISYYQVDLHESFDPVINLIDSVDVLIHLAWPGLPNYCDSFHIFKNLSYDLKFLESCIKSGLPRLIVAGTCLEYGRQSGELTEEMATMPVTPYGIAKDTLRKGLESLQVEIPFNLQWMRLFYLYGADQGGNSLLAQLDAAIDDGKDHFNMSLGDQLRDYLAVEEVAKNFCLALNTPNISGVINCSSGIPRTVLSMAERRREEKKSKIILNTGFYSKPKYEPEYFWGLPKKLRLMQEYKN